jgi:M6 family metalloprotease-like protein
VRFLVIAVVALALAGAAQAATCTQAEKDAAVAAVAAYQKKIPKERAAYFKKHTSKKKRSAFVKKQHAKLKRLRAAAACTVPPPPPPPPPPGPPPPPPPPPPAETVHPTLTTATLAGAVISLGFDEPIASATGVSVKVNGVDAAVTGTSVSGTTVSVTLASSTGADLIVVNASIRDLAGNETKLVSNAVTNPPAGGFAPALAKATWADMRGTEVGSTPEYGEWPIDHAYFLPATNVRILLLFVDQPNKPLHWPPEKTYERWTSITPPWERISSYGRLTVKIDRTQKVYRLSRDDYGPLPTGGGGPLKDFILEAAGLADPDVDFSRYDAIWIVGETGVGARQFRAWPENAVVLDGKPFTHIELADDWMVDEPFVADFEDGHLVTGAGATHDFLTHELGHHMGIPDLSYKPDPQTPYDFTRVAGWDMQDNPAGVFGGADYMAWNKWRLGWLDPPQIRGLTAPGTVETTLAPVETAGGIKLITAHVSPSYLYAVEVRRHYGNDAASVCDEGVLVYTVDSTKRNGLGPKFVFESHRGNDPTRISRCGLKYEAPFDVGPGEVSTFEDANVKVEVLSTDGVNYRVRVTRK